MFVEYSEYKSHPTKSFPVLHDIITVASIAAKLLLCFDSRQRYSSAIEDVFAYSEVDMC